MELSCAVITFNSSDEDVDARRISQSIREAIAYGHGPFTNIFELSIPCDGAPGPGPRLHNAGIREAIAHHADWIFFLYPGETLNPDTFIIAAPSLRLFDAVWGATGLQAEGSVAQRVVKKSRLACQSYETFFHLALNWWIGKSHFVKASVATKYLHDDDEALGYVKYLLSLWKAEQCLKTAHPLTTHRQEIEDFNPTQRQFILQHLETHRVFMTIKVAGKQVKLPYTGRNAGIEREQTRGIFFEQDELEYIAERLPDGCNIVDVGSNTGNHTVYFSLFMNPKRVTPIEPAPRCVAALKNSVNANNLTNVDMSKLGLGVGDKAGRYSLKLSERGGLGATQLQASESGDIEVLPLDEMIKEPVDFLKIDVESMELQVLKGAAQLISNSRPCIFIEIVDNNIPDFLNWVDDNDYRIEKIFPDKSHANYFLAPVDDTVQIRKGKAT